MTTFNAGEILYASDLQDMANQIASLTAPGWTSFTPTLSVSGGGFSIGNGTRSGRYRRAAGSDLIIYEGRVTWGSTTSNGSGGFISVDLPVNASAGSGTTILVPGSCQIIDSGTIRRSGQCELGDPTSLSFVVNAGDVTTTVPQTFANGDFIAWQIQYEPA